MEKKFEAIFGLITYIVKVRFSSAKVLCVLTVHLTQWLLTDNYHTRKLIQSCSLTTQPSTTTINGKND